MENSYCTSIQQKCECVRVCWGCWGDTVEGEEERSTQNDGELEGPTKNQEGSWVEMRMGEEVDLEFSLISSAGQLRDPWKVPLLLWVIISSSAECEGWPARLPGSASANTLR